jgi:DNA helicase-2/ATP-dependent DNA helicase PcrA
MNKQAPLLEGLTAEQKEAVIHAPEGKFRIAAGAGSGKTEVLTRRIVGMLKIGVAPKNLVAITYTQKAAAEMKNRLVERRKVSPAILRDMKVSTFHAFLGDFIKQDPFGAGIDRSDSVVPENDRQLILAELKEKFARLHGEEIINGPESLGATIAAKLINDFPAALSKIRRFLLKPGEFYKLSRHIFKQRQDSISSIEKHTLEWLFRFYTYFLEDLRNKNLLDFDEILIRGRSLVSDMLNAGERPAQNIFLIDEFQDNNPDQLNIIRMFAEHNNGHITVVGDEKQSIYRFQGADISTFRNFDSDKDVILTDNFRSYAEIISLADRFLEPGTEASHLSVPQNARRQESPRRPPVVCLTSQDQMTDAEICNQLTDFIDQMVTSGLTIIDRQSRESRPVRFGDIAIILSSVKSLPREFEDCLATRRIPYLLSGGLSFYARSEIEEILAFLRLLLQPNDDYAVTKILTGPLYGLKDSELSALALSGRNEKTSLLLHILSINESELPDPAKEFRRLFVFLKARSVRPGLLDLCHSLLEQAGFYEYAASQHDELKKRRMLNNLGKFLSIVRSFEQKGIFTSLRDFLNYIEKVLLSGIDEDEAGLGLEEGDAIKILTIHKSKGLEFPIVFCPFLKARKYRVKSKIYFDRQYGLMVPDPEEKGRKGFSRSLNEYVAQDQLASEKEDRRKLYVAFTRAEDLLIICGSEKNSLFEEKENSKSAPEPLAEIRNILEKDADLGECTPLENWPQILQKWLGYGEIMQQQTILPAVDKPDPKQISTELEHLITFLQKPVESKSNASVTNEIYSLQDLQLYRNCPRKYFFTSQHVSSFAQKPTNLSAISGTLFHETVRIFHDRSGHHLQSETEKSRLAEVIISDLCPLFGDDGLLVKNRVLQLFASYIASELSSLAPWQIEAEVNMKFMAPAGPFFLRGFADRVDKSPTEVKIIDFKTRSYSIEAHSSYADQLALYMIAATRGVLGDFGCLNFASCHIAYVSEQETRLVELSPDLLNFEQKAVETIEKIRNDTTWLPTSAKACENCGFAVFCHPSQKQITST